MLSIRTLVVACVLCSVVGTPQAWGDDITFSILSGNAVCNATGACACPLPAQMTCTATVCTIDGQVECATGDVIVQTGVTLQPALWVAGDGVSSTHGTITLRANATSGTVDIQAGGIVNADGRGFAGSASPGSGACSTAEGVNGNGNGPGYGRGGRCYVDAGGGGAYGGNGGRGVVDGNCNSAADGIGGSAYDTDPNAIERGSAGGAAGSSDNDSGGTGPSGGGAITLVGHNVIVSGTVRTRGSNGIVVNGDSQGGASGGGILLVAGNLVTCNTGNVVDVQGGNGAVGDDRGGAGGGGRIKLVTPNAVSGTCNYNVNAGTSGCAAGNGGTGLIGGNIAAPTLTAPVDGITTAIRRPPITGTVTDLTCANPAPTIDIYDNGLLLAAGVAVTCPAPLGTVAGTFSFTPTTDLAEGSHTFRAYVRKTISAVPFSSTASAARQIYIDVSDPVVTFPAYTNPNTSPTAGGSVADVSPTTVVVTYCPRTSSETCATMPVCTTGVHQSGVIAANPNFSYTPTILEVPDGTYCVRVVATDSISRTSTVSRELTLDRAAPVVAVDALIPVTQTPRVVCANITDASTISSVTASWTLDAAPQGALTVTAGACTMSDNSPGTHSVSVPGGANGAVVVSFVATDSLGQIGNGSGGFTADNTAPVVTLDAFSPNPTTTAALAGTTSDAGSAVTVSVSYCTLSIAQTCLDLVVCNSALTVSPVSVGTYSYDGASVPDGTYCVVATGTDSAGNTSFAQRDLVLDTTPPTISNDNLTSAEAPVAVCVLVQDTLTAAGLSASLTVNSIVQTAPVVSAQACSLLAGGTGNFLVTMNGPYPDGAAVLALLANDAAGNTLLVNEAFTVDSANPVVVVDSLIPVTQTPRVVCANITDASTLSSVTASWTLDAAPQGALAVTAGACTMTDNTPGTHRVTVPGGANGAVVVSFVATDSLAHIGNGSGGFTADNTAPVVTLDAFSPNPTNTAALAGTTSDANNAVTVSVSYCTLSIAQTCLDLVVCNSALTVSPVSSGTYSYNGSSVPDGTYCVVATGTDSAGNTSSAQRDLVLDTTPPTVSNDNLTSAQTPVTVCVLVQDTLTSVGLSASLTVNSITQAAPVVSAQACSLLAGGSGNFLVTLSGSYPDGAAVLGLLANDAAGNTLLVNEGFTVDNADPVVTFTQPSVALSSVTTASGTVSDATSVDVDLRYCLMGTGETCPLTLAVCDSRASANFPAATSFTLTPVLADGNYCIEASATDAAGNTSTQTSRLELDATPPTLNADTATVNGSPFSLCVSAEDVHPGTVTAAMTVDGGSSLSLTVEAASCMIDGSTPGNYLVRIPANVDGAVVVTVDAVDALGNASQLTRSLTVTPDGPVLGLYVSESPSGAERPLVFADVRDADGIASASIIVRSRDNLGVCGGVLHTETLTGAGAFAVEPWPAGLVADGTYCVELTATDNNGNDSSISIVVTKQANVPRLELSASPNPTTASNPVVVGDADISVTSVLVTYRELDELGACAGPIVDSSTVPVTDGVFSYTSGTAFSHVDACETYCVTAADQGSSVVAQTRFTHCNAATVDNAPMTVVVGDRENDAPVSVTGTAPTSATSVSVVIYATDSTGHCTEVVVSQTTGTLTAGSGNQTYTGASTGNLPVGEYCLIATSLNGTTPLVTAQERLTVVTPSSGSTTGGTSGSTTGSTTSSTGSTTGSTTGSATGADTGTSTGSDTGASTSGTDAGSTAGETSGSTGGNTAGGNSAGGDSSGDTTGTTGGATTGTTFNLAPGGRIAGTGCSETGEASGAAWLAAMALWLFARRRA